MRTLLVVLCIAAMVLAVAVVIVPILIAELTPSTRIAWVRIEATPVFETVALAGDLTFRGPPAA